MQENIFDNKCVLASNSAFYVIKNFFAKHLPLSAIDKEYITPTGHWGIGYAYINNNILVRSDRGYLDTEIILNNKSVSILSYNPELAKAKASSEKNILLILTVVHEVVMKYHQH
jgi:hypothetical protein